MFDKLFKFVGNWLLFFKNIKFSVEKKKDRKTKIDRENKDIQLNNSLSFKNKITCC